MKVSLLLPFSSPSCDTIHFVIGPIGRTTYCRHQKYLRYLSDRNIRGCIGPQSGGSIQQRWRMEEKRWPSVPCSWRRNTGVYSDGRLHKSHKFGRNPIGQKVEVPRCEYVHSDNVGFQCRHRFHGTCGSVRTFHGGHWIDILSLEEEKGGKCGREVGVVNF